MWSDGHESAMIVGMQWPIGPGTLYRDRSERHPLPHGVECRNRFSVVMRFGRVSLGACWSGLGWPDQHYLAARCQSWENLEKKQ